MSDNQEQEPLAKTQDVESKNKDSAVTSEDIDSEIKKKSLSPSDKLLDQETKDIERKQFLHGLAFFGGFTLFLIINSILYFRIHGVNLSAIFTSNDEELQAFVLAATNYGFIGAPGPPSPGSLILEVGFWSMVGVGIRTMYRASMAIRRKRFGILDYTVRFVGDVLLTVGITIAVMLFLRITTISIGGVELNFATASFETVVAVAFILGFFYEDTLELLGGFKEKIISSTGQEADKEK